MSEEKVLDYEIIDGSIVVKLDMDKDNEASIELRLNILEVIQEAIAKLSK